MWQSGKTGVKANKTKFKRHSMGKNQKKAKGMKRKHESLIIVTLAPSHTDEWNHNFLIPPLLFV